MKHIKLYEEDKWFGIPDIERKYWLLPTDERFEKSLEEIGSSPIFINSILNFKENYDKKYHQKYIYISKNDSGWSWMPYEKSSEVFFNKRDYVFSGNVNIEDEMTAIKYNI